MINLNELIAHISEKREQSLYEHVKNVADLAQKEGKKLGIENLMELTGLLHDMGKAGSNFQEYICKKDGI